MKRKIITKSYLLGLCMLLNFSINAQSTSKDDFKPSGKLWGYVFGDYYYKTHGDSLGRGKGTQYQGIKPSSTDKNPNASQTDAFQLRRIYLGYDYFITKKISAYTLLTHEQNVDGSGNFTFYIKNAYLKWTDIFPKSNLLIGLISTTAFSSAENTEALWGYRSIEKTIMDMHGIAGSKDIGVSLQGKLWQEKNPSDSLKPVSIGYQIMISNNTGSKPENDRFKLYSGTVFTKLFKQSLTLGVYSDFNRNKYTPYHTSNLTFKAYAHWKSKMISIGTEVFNQKNENSDTYQYSGKTVIDKSNGMQAGWSVFVTGTILKEKLNYFLRYDRYNPNLNFHSDAKYLTSNTANPDCIETFYTFGLDYTPISKVHIMPNIWINKYTSQLNNATGKVKSDYDLVPRLTLYYIFK